jgi:hypothetical protein
MRNLLVEIRTTTIRVARIRPGADVCDLQIATRLETLYEGDSFEDAMKVIAEQQYLEVEST